MAAAGGTACLVGDVTVPGDIFLTASNASIYGIDNDYMQTNIYAGGTIDINGDNAAINGSAATVTSVGDITLSSNQSYIDAEKTVYTDGILTINSTGGEAWINSGTVATGINGVVINSDASYARLDNNVEIYSDYNFEMHAAAGITYGQNEIVQVGQDVLFDASNEILTYNSGYFDMSAGRDITFTGSNGVQPGNNSTLWAGRNILISSTNYSAYTGSYSTTEALGDITITAPNDTAYLMGHSTVNAGG